MQRQLPTEDAIYGTNPYYRIPREAPERERKKAEHAIRRYLHLRKNGNRRKSRKWYHIFRHNGGDMFIMDEAHLYLRGAQEQEALLEVFNKLRHRPSSPMQATQDSKTDLVG